MTVEIPSESARNRRIALAASAVVVVAALVTAGVWWINRPAPTPPPKRVIEPAQETSAPPSAPSSGVVATQSPVPDSGTASPTGAPSKSADARIVFRLGTKLYVAKPDGTDATPVASAVEVYALSPDGTKLAVVVAPGEPVPAGVRAGTTLAVIDLATKQAKAVGKDAVPVEPSWAPDSSWLAYTAKSGGQTAVKRVAIGGRGDEVLVSPGTSPVVSPDGRRVAYSASLPSGVADSVRVISVPGPRAVAVPDSAGASSWGWTPAGDLYFVRKGAAQDTWDLWRWSASGGSARVGSVGLEPPAFALSRILVSPDGARVAVSATGDDDYSRIWIFDTAAARFVSVSTRRDAYPYTWLPDGRLAYYEGNVYQGEPSMLASIMGDGTGRRLVVTGAQQ